MGVRHSTVVVVADDGISPVGTDEWNADHVVTGGEYRDVVTTHRTYYVNNVTGSDSDTGLSSALAFATIQKAVNVICDTLYLKAQVIIQVETTGVDYQEIIDLKPWQGVPLGYMAGNGINDFWGTVEIIGDLNDPESVRLAPTFALPFDPYVICLVQAKGPGARWKWSSITNDPSGITGTQGCGNYAAFNGAYLEVCGGNLGKTYDPNFGTFVFAAFHGATIRWSNGILIGYDSHIYGAGNGTTEFPVFASADHDSVCEIDRSLIIFDDDPKYATFAGAEINSAVYFGHNCGFGGVTVTATTQISIRDSSRGHTRTLAATFPGAGGFKTVSFNSSWTFLCAETDHPGGIPNTLAILNSNVIFEGMIAVITDSTTTTWGANITGGGANRVLAYYNGTNWTVMGK